MRPILEPFMLPNVLKKQIYSGILEVLKDRKCYYRSTVGGGHYSYFTEEGEKAIMHYIKTMAPTMLDQHDYEMNEIAKKMVWEELKK